MGMVVPELELTAVTNNIFFFPPEKTIFLTHSFPICSHLPVSCSACCLSLQCVLRHPAWLRAVVGAGGCQHIVAAGSDEGMRK